MKAKRGNVIIYPTPEVDIRIQYGKLALMVIIFFSIANNAIQDFQT